jgi:hypothetical protein
MFQYLFNAKKNQSKRLDKESNEAEWYGPIQ